MLSGIASLLSIVILSRLLPAEAYGRIAVVLAIASVCQVAAFSWIQASITRLAPDGQAARDRFAAGVRAGFMLSTAAMALACAAFLLAFRPSLDQSALGIAGLAVLLCNAWAAAGQAWSRVSDHPWRYAMSGSVQALGGLGLAIAGLAWRPGDPLVPLVAAAVASLLASSIAHVPGGGGSLRAVAPQLRRMLVYAGPLVAVALGWVVLGAADRLLIATLLGPAAAGAWSVASGLASRAVGLLLVPISLSTRSLVFVEFDRRGAEAANALLQNVASWLTAVGLPVTILLVCAPDVLASAIVGEQLAVAAAEVLPWTAVGALLSALLTSHFVLGFQVTRQTWWTLLAMAPAAAVDIMSNIVLLPRFGIVAAGWSTVGSTIVALALTVVFGRRHFRVPFSIADVLRTLAACIPLVGFLQLRFPPNVGGLAAMLSGAALIYVASALALNVAASRSWLARRLRIRQAHP